MWSLNSVTCTSNILPNSKSEFMVSQQHPSNFTHRLKYKTKKLPKGPGKLMLVLIVLGGRSHGRRIMLFEFLNSITLVFSISRM